MAIDLSLVAGNDERAPRKPPIGVGIDRLDTGIEYRYLLRYGIGYG